MSCFQSSPAGNASLDHQGNGRGREPSGEPSGTAHFKLFPMSLPSGFTLRRSTTADLDTLVEHRRAMFQDMGYTDQETMGAMAAKFRPWLLAHMNAGDYLAWVITAPHDFIAASSGLWLLDWPPHLVGKGTHRGNILNVYTYPSFRRRGLARELMQAVLSWCRGNGVDTVILHASDSGACPLRIDGFCPVGPGHAWERHQSRTVVRGGLVRLLPVSAEIGGDGDESPAARRCRGEWRGGSGHDQRRVFHSGPSQRRVARSRPRGGPGAGGRRPPAVSVLQSYPREHQRRDHDRHARRHQRGLKR